MVKVDLLEPFVPYRAKPPIIMPEDERNRKKGSAFMLYAPNISQELRYLSSGGNTNLKFRYLTRYFIEKRWAASLYGQAKRIIKLNEDGDISTLLESYNKTGNLTQISGVTSFYDTVKTSPLKDFNVLAEVNHVIDAVMNNPKDHRMLYAKTESLAEELIAHANISYLGNYRLTVIIPMDLWFTHEEYNKGNALFRPAAKSFMGCLLNDLMTKERLTALGRVILVDGSTLMIMDASSVPADTEDFHAYCMNKILQFMKKAKSSSDATVFEEEEEDEESDSSELSMARAESQTKTDIETEQILDAARIDPDTATKETKEQIKAVIKKTDTGEAVSATAEETLAAVDTKDQEKIADTILNAQMKGRSAASEKRNEMLKERYKELSVGTSPVADIIEKETAAEIPKVEVKSHTVNESMKKLKGYNFERSYNENLAQRDLVNILLHFSTTSPAMYLNKDIKIEDVSTRMDRMLKYSVEFEDENRKRHRFSFLLPKMYKDKYFYLNDMELVITHQKVPFPVTKIQPDRCQLVTNYNKIFVYRYGAALSPRIQKLKKVLSAPGMSRISLRKGDGTTVNKPYLTTIEYDDISSSYVKISMGTSADSLVLDFIVDNCWLYINRNNAPKQVQSVTSDSPDSMIEDTSLSPLGQHKKGKDVDATFWISGNTNQVYDQNGKPYGELSEFLTEALIHYEPKLEKDLADSSAGTKFMYSRVRIMHQDIPTILVMGAADPNGLLGALEKGKLNYEFVQTRPRVDKNVTGVVPFKDGYLTYDRYPYENSLLMNGLSVVPTKEYDFYDMNTREAYVEIFDTLCGRATLVDSLQAFYYVMVDPITRDVLETLKMPTDFITLLYYCNGVLADNSFQIDSNYENSRVRSNEIVYSYLYRELALAWSNFRMGKTDTFSIPEDVIIKLILTSNIVDPKSKLNMTLELESMNQIKLKGPEGMNEDRSFTMEKRAYHPSMRGIVGMNSPDSGEVGIGRHMVLNPNIDNARGFITVNKDDYDGTELMTAGEALQTFAGEAADIERVAMAISQSKHLVPVASQCSSPISYDMERVAPYMSKDFAHQAKDDGQVVEIKENLMIVKYNDGTFDDIDLSEHPERNTDGGFYIMNQMKPRLKPGEKFKAGDILATDPKYINNNDFFGDPCANVGTLARVSLEINGCVYEDSGYITDEFAHRMATKITRQKRVILSRFANIKYMVRIGQKVQVNDPILVFDDTEDEFSAQLLASMAAEAEDEDEITATSAPVISKYAGVIKDIVITYTVPTDQMTPSLKKVVDEYAADAAKREKELTKYIDTRDSNTILKSSEISVPDSQGKVKGVKVGDGVFIDFYIEYDDVMGNADKGSSYTALKFTNCYVIPAGLAGYTDFDPDRKIDLGISAVGAFKRMTADVEKVGILTKVLVESKRLMKEKYGRKIKDELNKKR